MVLGLDDSNQNQDVSESIDNIEISDSIITLLKDKISLLGQHKISPTAAFSDNNDDNANINNSSKSINKDRYSSKNNPLTNERKSVTILGESLLNGTNEKGLTHFMPLISFDTP